MVLNTKLIRQISYLIVLMFPVFFIGIKIIRAQDAPTIVSDFINNSAFALSDSYPTGNINTLNAGSFKNLYLNGLVEDLDGYTDITNVKGVFYRSGVTNGYNCTPDKNDCYVVEDCDTQVVIENQNQLVFSCEVPVYYFADSTVSGGRYPSNDWRVYIKVDDSTTSATTNDISKELEEILALEIPESVDFGAMSLGQATTSGTGKKMTILQNGNTPASVLVSSTDTFICSVRGTIPQANLRWSTADEGWGQATSITATPTNAIINVTYQDNDEQPSSDDLYWNLKIPTSGLEGICTNLTTVTASLF